MSDKVFLYSTLKYDNPIPVTARIEWLPCGTVKPLEYWTPDESHYKISHVLECTQMAHLKDRGIGIRFKVCSQLSEPHDLFCDNQYIHHETYLYFSDNWFCGENFIDSRYKHHGKEFIHVTLDVFPDGKYEVVYFCVKGERYKVEKTHAVELGGSFNAGGVGIWHKVDARLVNMNDDEDPVLHNSKRRMAALYFEINKWFVSIKSA